MKKFKAGIVGAAGYTGGELIRLLLNHPDVEISFAQSRSNAGKKFYAVHSDLIGETEMEFSSGISDADAIFLCMGHGESKKWVKTNPVSGCTRIIDLSQDFRIEGGEFIYGLPELQREKIANAKHIANPGCFATAIQLALIPAVEAGVINSNISITATTGSTGAGQSLSPTSHFTWRHGNHSAYKELEHQHLAEIGEAFSQLNPSFGQALHFIPQRGAFTRGIHCIAHFEMKSDANIASLYRKWYSGHAFTLVSETPVDMKQVVNTNKCLLHVLRSGDRVIVTSVIDNLLKGASGQAVQNMNLMLGLDERSGLQLKPSAY